MKSRHLITELVPQPRGPTPVAQLAGVLSEPGPGAATGFLWSDVALLRGSVFSSAGTARLDFGPAPTGYMWLLQRVNVQAGDDADRPGSRVSIYLGPIEPINLAEGSLFGDLNTADGDPPLYVPGGVTVSLLWTNAGDGYLCTATLQVVTAQLAG